MKNFDGPIWFLKDMSVGLTAFRTEYPLLMLDLPKTNHSKLTYLDFAGLIDTVVKGKNNITAIYSLIKTKKYPCGFIT